MISGPGSWDLGRGATWRVPVGSCPRAPGMKIFNWRRVHAAVVHDYKATRSPGHAAVPCSGRLADWAVIKKCWTQRRRWGCPRRLARASGAGYPVRRAGQR